MKIRSISIQGFRGFNNEQTINFHDQLSLIYAPNSYGKTSISEALEWLLYGITSKVRKADSKEEYKGSYRNRHLLDSAIPTVKAFLFDSSCEIEIAAELIDEDTIKKYINQNETDSWPFSERLPAPPGPFILQHALKYLLLVRPDERFQGFARLLGLEELDTILRNVVSLCTKPDAHIPAKVDQLRKEISAIEARVLSHPSLINISKGLKKGKNGLSVTYNIVMSECVRRVPPGTDEKSFVPKLLKIREDAVSKIFRDRIAVPHYSESDQRENSADEEFILSLITEEFVQKYTELTALSTVQHILEVAQFYDLGIKLVDTTSMKCPFCSQSIDKSLLEHIHEQHKRHSKEKEVHSKLKRKHEEITHSLGMLKKSINSYQDRNLGKAESLLRFELVLPQLKNILVPKHTSHFNVVETFINQLKSAVDALLTACSDVIFSLNDIEAAITTSKADSSLMEKLGESIIKYVNETHSYIKFISSNTPTLTDADQILKRELDTLAGTEDITILVDLIEHWKDIKRKFEIDAIIDSLKVMRKEVEQHVANKILDLISGELTSKVMEWYGQIKTTGDPDVHFDGFDMERTIKGELKARRVQIKATSYGKNLVSAISCLSESKLNALGLCVSIATNLKDNSPFEFVVIDDPIQSWDADHETKFIQVIQKLVEDGKQVILLSHNKQWLNQVRKGCRSINGWYYEITGYTENGPHLIEEPWDTYKGRLNEVSAILNDPMASSTTLQRAEGEIRIAIEDMLYQLSFNKTGIKKSCRKLNSKEVRKILIECGVDNRLVDNITSTYETTDPSHHSDENYSPNKERIKCYHSWVHELSHTLN